MDAVNLAGLDLNLLVSLDALLQERSVTQGGGADGAQPAGGVGVSSPGSGGTSATNCSPEPATSTG